MKQLLKKIIAKTPLLCNLERMRIQRKKISNWNKRGRPAPPPHLVKQQTLKVYARKYELKILVETGTYLGEMVDAMKRNFDRIISIELSTGLYEKARESFKEVGHIELIHGDSGVEIRNVLNRINRPALFWLDGHYSGGVTAKGDKDTPIYEELDHILNAKVRGHVIIIDDARLFGTDPAYPSIGDLSGFVTLKRPDMDMVVQDDMIRITPRK